MRIRHTYLLAIWLMLVGLLVCPTSWATTPHEDITWYVHVTDQSTLDRVSNTPHAGWMYDKNAAEAPACYGKTINRLRLNVAQAGTFTIGKTDGTTYTPLQTLELTNATTNPSQATLQIYAIQPITLGDNERLVFGQPSDTGKFYYGTGAEGVFINRVSATLPAGADYNNLNLSIDIGYSPELQHTLTVAANDETMGRVTPSGGVSTLIMRVL